MKCVADPSVNLSLRAASVAATLALLAGLATAQVFETSDDGRTTAAVRPQPADNTGSVRGASVPYPTTPDVEINLRRQVGGLRVADMNADGLPDVVAVCFHSQAFPAYEDWHDMIFFNTGTSIEPTPSWVSTEQVHTGDVQVGDLDGDGHPEIVTIHGGVSGQSVRVYTGSAAGPATTAAYVSATPIPVWGTAGTLADADNDGDLDLFTTNQGVSPDAFKPNFLFRNTDGSFPTAPTWASGDAAVQNGVAAGDVNGDGFDDFVVAKWVNFESGIYYNNAGTPAPTPAWTVDNTDADKGAVAADFNGDGLLDIAFGGDPSRAFQQDNDGQFTQVWANTDPFSGTQDIRGVDVDNDGDTDLAEIHFSTGRTHIYLNEDGVLNPVPAWTYDASEVGNALAFGDINGDGWPDLVTGYSGDISIRVFFARPPECPADFNTDGTLDFFDVLDFLDAFSNEDPRADLTGDGLFDFFDVQDYLEAFAAGCP
jgi:hypothetical protein